LLELELVELGRRQDLIQLDEQSIGASGVIKKVRRCKACAVQNPTLQVAREGADPFDDRSQFRDGLLIVSRFRVDLPEIF
jgi:hypothetical protein